MRLYRLCLLAYPRAYRRERGGEILATIADGGGGFRIREAAALLAGGVRARGVAASGGTDSGMWASGAQLGALIVLVYTVFMNLRPELIVGGSVWVPVVAALCVCRGRVGLACLVVLVGAGAWIEALPHATYALWTDPTVFGAKLYASSVSMSLFLLAPALILWPTRKVAVSARHSMLWLALPVILTVFANHGYYASTLAFGTLAVVGAVLLMLSRLDPRLGLAALAAGTCAALYLIPVVLLPTAYKYAIWAAALSLLAAGAGLASARRRPAL